MSEIPEELKAKRDDLAKHYGIEIVPLTYRRPCFTVDLHLGNPQQYETVYQPNECAIRSFSEGFNKCFELMKEREAKLKIRIDDLEKSELQLIDERDRYEGRINEVADLLGDLREWSSCNDRGENCIESVESLQNENAKLKAQLKEAMRQRDEYRSMCLSGEVPTRIVISDNEKIEGAGNE